MHLLQLYAHANTFIFAYSPLTRSNEPTIKNPTPRNSKLKNKDHHCIPSLHHPDDCNLAASVLMNAGASMRKGVYRLNCLEIPSRRRLADDRLPVLLSSNCQMNPIHKTIIPGNICTTWKNTPGMENSTHLRCCRFLTI